MADMIIQEEDEEVSSKEQTSSTSNVEEEKQGLDDTLPFGGESSLAQSSILTDEEHILRYRETQTSLSLALLTSQENEKRRIQSLPAHLREIRNWFKNKLWLASVMTDLTPTTINSIGVKLFDGAVADRPKNIQELLELLLREHKGLMALLVLCEQQLGPIHGLKRTREDRNLEKESGRGGEAEVTLRGEAEVTLKLDRSLVERGDW